MSSSPVSRAYVALLVAAALVTACDSTSPKPPQVALRLEKGSVAIGEVATLVRDSGSLSEASYSGTLASTAITLARVDDSTLAFVVPSVATGQADIVVSLGQVEGTARMTVTAGATITDPAATTNAAFDAVVATAVTVPAPAGYGAGWTADSAYLSAQIASARAAFNALSAEDKLELARFVGATSAQFAARRATFATINTACTEKVEAWAKSMTLAERNWWVTSSAVSAKESWGPIALVYALARFADAVAEAFEMDHFCRVEEKIVATPTERTTDTEVTITADQRTILDGDFTDTHLKTLDEETREKESALWTWIKQKFERVPVHNRAGTVVASGVPIDADDEVTVETTQVTGPDGQPVNVSATKTGTGKYLLKATSTLASKIERALNIRIVPPKTKATTIAPSLPIRPICYEDGGTFPTCADNLSINPSSFTLGLNGSRRIEPFVRDASGNILSGRTVRWSSSDNSIATVNASGDVTGVSAGTATIYATAGNVTGSKRGAASVTVSNACDYSWIKGSYTGVTTDPYYRQFPMGTGIVNQGTNVPVVVVSSSLTIGDGTFDQVTEWYMKFSDSDKHYSLGGVIAGSTTTRYTGTYTATCAFEGGADRATISITSFTSETPSAPEYSGLGKGSIIIRQYGGPSGGAPEKRLTTTVQVWPGVTVTEPTVLYSGTP